MKFNVGDVAAMFTLKACNRMLYAAANLGLA